MKTRPEPSRLLDAGLLLLALAAVTIANILFLKLDRYGFSGDEASHLIYGVQLYEDLSRFLEIKEWPPLPYLPAVALFHLFGPSRQTAIIANLFWVWMAILSIYWIGDRLFDRRAGLLAALVMIGFPVTLGLSRIYLAESAWTAITVLSFAVFLSTDDFKRRLPSVCFGICCGLGLLTKIAFPVFIGPPLLVFLARALLRRDFGAWQVVNMLLAAATTAAIALIWYSPDSFLIRSTSLHPTKANPMSFIVEGYGRGLFLYLYSMIDFSMSYLGYFVLAAVIFLTASKHRARTLPLILWFVVPLLLFSLFPKKAARYLYPSFPAAALMLSYAVFTIRSRLARNVTIGALLAWAAVVLVLLTVPIDRGRRHHRFLIETPHHGAVAHRLGLSFLHYREDFWIRPPLPASFGFEKIVQIMDRYNQQALPARRARHCFQLVNLSRELTQGSGIIHPLSWPLKSYLALNRREYRHESLVYRQGRLHWWSPDGEHRRLPREHYPRCSFVVALPSEVRDAAARHLRLRALGSVESALSPGLRNEVKVYLFDRERLP